MLMKMAHLSEHLSTVSEAAPVESIDWPSALDLDQWFMAPELLSLHGCELFDALDEKTRKRLSFYEAVNFFSLNIYGEKPLVAGLADRLYARGFDEVSRYLHHFLSEENRHMQYFARFCHSYAGKIYPEKKFKIPADHSQAEEDVIFFAQAVVFELLVDHYNAINAADERLAPIARSINRLHHVDETRHLAFGRRLLAELWSAYAGDWGVPTRLKVRSSIDAFLNLTWRQYYNPEVYGDAGLPDPYSTMEIAWNAPDRVAFRAKVSEEIQTVLRQAGLDDGGRA